jgi:hypothetical protein
MKQAEVGEEREIKMYWAQETSNFRKKVEG